MSVNITVENVSQNNIYVKAQSNRYGARTFEWYLNNALIATKTGTDNGSGYYYNYHTFTGLNPGTNYKISVKVKNSSGSVVAENFIYVTTSSNRPANFQWTTSKVSGGNFNITAQEWNGFLNRINQFREYKNMPRYNFTFASQGGIFYAYMFNQAVQAISAMNPPISPPSTRSSGDDMYASYFNRLVSSLNSIQ